MKRLQVVTVCGLCALWIQLSIVLGQSPKFSHLTTNQGLSQSHISAILKDGAGFMWFGTEDGLNKYDGYRFTHYKQDLTNANSIGDSYIQDLLEDVSGNLWVATANGLDRYDRFKNRFIHYPNGKETYGVNTLCQDSRNRLWIGTDQGLFLFNTRTGQYRSYRHIFEKLTGKHSEYINQIIEGKKGDLWIGTEDGLYRYTIATDQLIAYRADSRVNNKIQSNWITSLYKDQEGDIWIGTRGGGVSLYNETRREFRTYRHDLKNSQSVAYDDILSIMEDHHGDVWIGTENGGISVYDKNHKTFTTYQNDQYNNASLNNNSVYCLYRDNADNMWVGTYAGGVNYVPRYGEKFMSYRQRTNDPNSLSNNAVLSLTGEPAGTSIWIGTDGGGLNKFDRQTKQFKHYRHDDKNTNSPSTDFILSVIRVAPDVLALGYHNGGFDLFNVKTGVFTHHLPKANDQQSISIADVNNLFKDREGNLWIGTWKGGLDCYNLAKQTFTHYRTSLTDTTSISDDIVTTVFEDEQGTIWAGTYKGLNRLDRNRKQFKRYQHNSQNKYSISNNNIQCIRGADRGNLWIGTVGGGLNYFDQHNQTFTSYTQKEGLASNVVFAIQKDIHNDLWLSTNNGLSRFNPGTKTFSNFSFSDGLQGNEFRDNSSFQTANGQLFFGGVNGFSTFHPDSISRNSYVPPVCITDFMVFNKSVQPGDKDQILQHQICETDRLSLSYKQSVFTFEFSALNYTVPEKNQYAYMLEGFDEGWNYSGTKRTATYTHLDPGTYVFKVKAANNDGLWNNKGTSITVVITPPYWLTWWFKSLAGMLFLGGLYALFRLRINRIQARQLILQNQVRAQTLEVLQQKQEIQDKTLKVQLLQAKVEQQTALQQLQESEQRFQEIADIVDEVFWIHAAEPFQLVYVNAAFERVWNTTVACFYKDAFSLLESILPEDQPVVQTFINQYKAGTEGQLYCRLKPKGEPFRWLLIRTFIIRDANGKVLRHIGVVNDVTSQKEKESVLQQALQREQELNQLKSQFVSTASHEFRTPLTTIQSSAELIKMYLDLPADRSRGAIQKHVAVIESQIKHFDSLLTDILTIGIIEAGKIPFTPKWIDLVHLCEESIADHFGQRSDKRSVTLMIEGTPGLIFLDAKLVKLVLINLLSNAFKFSDESPVLKLIFSETNCQIQIIDEGIGIPEGEVSKLFQPFLRASNTNETPGTGLGLFISRQFIELHKGQITVESEEKQGTVFTVTLPFFQSETVPLQSPVWLEPNSTK